MKKAKGLGFRPGIAAWAHFHDLNSLGPVGSLGLMAKAMQCKTDRPISFTRRTGAQELHFASRPPEPPKRWPRMSVEVQAVTAFGERANFCSMVSSGPGAEESLVCTGFPAQRQPLRQSCSLSRGQEVISAGYAVPLRGCQLQQYHPNQRQSCCLSKSGQTSCADNCFIAFSAGPPPTFRRSPYPSGEAPQG